MQLNRIIQKLINNELISILKETIFNTAQLVKRQPHADKDVSQFITSYPENQISPVDI